MSNRLLAGRYELIEKIGEGGMAIVYKGKDRLLNRYVAIKILRPEYTKDDLFIENFRKESQAAAGLTHPNIVGVYDVGKRTTLAMMAKNTSADLNVIALIGERGREVREFIDTTLGEEGMRRSIVIVATSEQPSLVKIKAAFVAIAIAEYFRDEGKDVLFMLDSVTRIAMAQREVGLAVGEPPATRGYTPSVFALMPKLMERTGAGEKGTITGLYTVLVEGDETSRKPDG